MPINKTEIINCYKQFISELKLILNDKIIIPFNDFETNLVYYLNMFNIYFDKESNYKKSYSLLIAYSQIKLDNEEFNKIYPIVIQFVEKVKKLL